MGRVRRAGEVGHPEAAYRLGELLEGQGKARPAESWFRRAADAGHAVAAYRLALLLRARGEAEETEAWYRRAVEVGHADAAYDLGRLISGGGGSEEAEALWRTHYDVWQKRLTRQWRIRNQPFQIGRETVDDMVAAGRMYAGAPSTVAQQLSELISESGVNYLLGVFSFGNLSSARALHSLALFCRDVMPAVRAAVGEPAPVG